MVKGYPDRTFRPFNLITRAEAVKMLDVVTQYIEVPEPSEIPLVPMETPTPTVTPESTATPTSTPNSTPKQTASIGGGTVETKSTPTKSLTPTPNQTPTFIPTQSPTSTPTQSPTPIQTQSPTPSPTPTLSTLKVNVGTVEGEINEEIIILYLLKVLQKAGYTAVNLYCPLTLIL